MVREVEFEEFGIARLYQGSIPKQVALKHGCRTTPSVADRGVRGAKIRNLAALGVFGIRSMGKLPRQLTYSLGCNSIITTCDFYLGDD